MILIQSLFTDNRLCFFSSYISLVGDLDFLLFLDFFFGESSSLGALLIFIVTYATPFVDSLD